MRIYNYNNIYACASRVGVRHQFYTEYGVTLPFYSVLLVFAHVHHTHSSCIYDYVKEQRGKSIRANTRQRDKAKRVAS